MNDETLLVFPCDFPIKMMGRDSEEFRDTARALVEHHTGPLGDQSIKVRDQPQWQFRFNNHHRTGAEPAAVGRHLP